MFGQLDARIRKLETYRPSPPQLAPSAMKLLSSQSLAGTSQPYSATWATYWQPTFTLAAASDVFVFSTVSFEGPGGTASWVYAGYSIDGATQVGFAIEAAATAVGQMANATLIAVHAGLAAGTHTCKFWYHHSPGYATTTFTMPSDTPQQLEVFALGNGTVAIP